MTQLRTGLRWGLGLLVAVGLLGMAGGARGQEFPTQIGVLAGEERGGEKGVPERHATLPSGTKRTLQTPTPARKKGSAAAAQWPPPYGAQSPKG